jgi:hypothetical protein
MILSLICFSLTFFCFGFIFMIIYSRFVEKHKDKFMNKLIKADIYHIRKKMRQK